MLDMPGSISINFDGWHFLTMPLPPIDGGVPGKSSGDNNWRSDEDRIVDYPVTLTGIALVMNDDVAYLNQLRTIEVPTVCVRELSAVY
jgi:hypothetical protein